MTAELDNIDFERLIGDRNIDVCELIEMMNEDGIALALLKCVCRTTRRRWPEAEPYIMENSYSAYLYARDIIKGRWIEAEPLIRKELLWAECYNLRFGVRL